MDPAAIDGAKLRADYERDGYAIVRGVFSPAEVAELQGRFDAWRDECLAKHDSTFVCGNHRVWVGHGAGGVPPHNRLLRGLQWPSYSDPVLDKYRTDPRMFAIASALLGPSIKQIINQMHWKEPGSLTQWRYHQDVRSRTPASAFRDLFHSYINTGIAVERCTAETGGMKIIPRSHVGGRDLGIEAVAAAMGIDKGAPTDAALAEMLRAVGADPDALVTLELAPGDVALWHPFAIHGGGLNTATDGCRRAFYINGYVTAANCDRGHLAWDAGVPQPLGAPVLIQLDNYAETLAEGGRYYAEASPTGNNGAQVDREMERERELAAAAAAAMNLVRD